MNTDIKIKMMNKRAGVSYFQIVLLVLASFAFSYFVSENNNEIKKSLDEVGFEGKLPKRIGYFGAFVFNFFNQLKKPMFPVVSADEVDDALENGFSCCERTTENEICHDVGLQSECASGFQQYTSCEQTANCRKGCCIDEYEGTYDKNVPKTLCQGTFNSDRNCNIPGVEFGCCVIGPRTYFTTQQACIRKTEREPNGTIEQADWQGDKDEAQCYIMSQIQEQGACVLSGGVSGGSSSSDNSDAQGKNCKFTTHAECLGLNGMFNKNLLCTSSSLGTKCEKTDKTTCVDGKDGVYFLDSCGNSANIYDSSKVNDNEYWNRLLGIDDNSLCGSNSENGNANSKSCGNCNRFLGGMCASALENNFDVDKGDYYCKDTSCVFDGKNYKNGESWCVYDGKIDDGDDVVGSRHWKYVCNQGVIQIEPCADYRNQVCFQSNTFDISLNGTEQEVEFRNAACIANNWRKCIDLNSEKKGIDECENTLNCRVEDVDIADKFKFKICTPRYPGGFKLGPDSERYQTTAAQICGMATQTCTVIYQQTLTGGCECVTNCECEEAVFAQKMNDFCRKLGDCGLEVNVEGKYNTGNPSYKVKKSPKLSSSWIGKLIALSNPVKGQYAEVEEGRYDEYLEAAGLLGLPDDSGNEDGGDGGGGGIDMTKVGLGGLGISMAMTFVAWKSVYLASELGGKLILSKGLGLFPKLPPGYINGAIVFSIGMIAGSMLAKALGLSPLGSMLMSVGVGLLALGISMHLNILGLGGLCPACIPYIIAIAIIMIITSLFFGGSDCKPVKVEFVCKPWQPPAGSDDCSKCNDNLLKPCSEYRCASLGAGCELVNKGTSEEMCDSANDDGGYPQIEPQLGTISPTEKYSDIKEGRGFRITNLQGGCVNAYTPLVFGLTTNELSVCKFDIQQKDFEDMSEDFGSNSYKYNHTTTFVLPDPSHGQSQGINWHGDLTLYIKCRDRWDHENPSFYNVELCVNEADDVSPPIIQAVIPSSETLISFNATEKDIEVYTNEPSDCKWSLSSSKSYDEMENSMTCESDSIEDAPYVCTTILPVNSTDNLFYFKCKDQPWISGEDDRDRNAMTQNYNYVLTKPSKGLTIDWIMPDDDLESPTAITTVVLKVQTSGGGEYPSCDYSFSGYENMIDFNDFDFSSPHEQEFNRIPVGRHRIYVECEDETGDKVRGETTFRIIHDTSAPKIARIYQLGSSLKIITTEDAECVYSEKSCSYNFVNGTSIGSGKEHSISVTKGRKYHIKCKDEFGNVPSGYSIIVRPSGLRMY